MTIGDRVYNAVRAGWASGLPALVAGAALLLGNGLQARWIELSIGLLATATAIAATSTQTRGILGDLPFASLVALAGIAILAGCNTVLSIVAVATTAVAWDLHHLRGRLALVDELVEERLLVSGHVTRLLLAVGLGTGLALLTQVFSLRYGVGIAAAAGLIAAVGLSRVISHLRSNLV
jgi:hypothetical protein